MSANAAASQPAASTSRWAPADRFGKVPYIVEGIKEHERVSMLVYAKTQAKARFLAGNRGIQIIAKVRRALRTDLVA